MVHLKPEAILEIGNFELTNTLITSVFVVLILVIFFLLIKFNLKPSKIQLFLEILYETIFKLWSEITGLKNLLIFSFCLSFFIYIALANLIILVPPFEAIYFRKGEEKIHLFRSVFSDLNMTLALAIISVVVTNILGIIKSGFNFFKKFFSPLGLLELISEFAKIISFSFRLFGNIFAGKVLLLIISYLVVLIIPSVFIGLEIFVGLIQAFIFFVLTSVFIKVAFEH